MSRLSRAVDGVQSSDVPISFVNDIGLQTWIYSGYMQDEWKLTEKLTFNYGVRFDLYDGLVRADQASPRAAFEYKLFKEHHAARRLCAPDDAARDRTGVSRQYQAAQRHDGRAAFEWQRHADGRARSFVRRGRNAGGHPRTERRDRFVLQEGVRPDRRRPVRPGAYLRDLQLQQGPRLGNRVHQLVHSRKLSTSTTTSPTASRRARRSSRGNSTSRRTN